MRVILRSNAAGLSGENIKIESIAPREVYVPSVDGLRGISILMVLFVHLSYFVSPTVSGQPVYLFPESIAIIWSGTYGVRLFFMLSAYTLFRSYSFRHKQEHAPRFNFFIRRAFRILPLWWVWVLIYGTWGPQSHELRSIVATAFFYMVFLRGGIYPEVWSGGWSIYVEETFYLFFPLWFRLIDSVNKAAVWVVIGWLTADVWRWAAVHFELPYQYGFIPLFPLDNYFCFFVGILFFQLEQANFMHRLCRLSNVWLRVVDLGVLTLLALLMPTDHRRASLALALVFLTSFNEKSLFGRISRNRILQKFGISCFSIYLMHQFLLPHLSAPMLAVGNWLGLPVSVELRTLFWFPIFSTFMLGLGLLSFYKIEMPFVNLARRIIVWHELRKLAHFPSLK